MTSEQKKSNLRLGLVLASVAAAAQKSPLSIINQSSCLRQTNLLMLRKLVVVALGMFGFGYALVPIVQTRFVRCNRHQYFGVGRKGVARFWQRTACPQAAKQPDLIPTAPSPWNLMPMPRGPWHFQPMQNSDSGASWATDGDCDVRISKRARSNHVCTGYSQLCATVKPRVRTSIWWSAFATTNTPWRLARKKQWPVVFVVDKKLSKRRDHHYLVLYLL
jgi:cytochrome c oxidase assembly protein subunit 11